VTITHLKRASSTLLRYKISPDRFIDLSMYGDDVRFLIESVGVVRFVEFMAQYDRPLFIVFCIGNKHVDKFQETFGDAFVDLMCSRMSGCQLKVPLGVCILEQLMAIEAAVLHGREGMDTRRIATMQCVTCRAVSYRIKRMRGKIGGVKWIM